MKLSEYLSKHKIADGLVIMAIEAEPSHFQAVKDGRVLPTDKLRNAIKQYLGGVDIEYRLTSDAGVRRLREYLQINRFSDVRAAEALKCSREHFNRVKYGKAYPSKELQLRIAKWTDGEVRLEHWPQRRPLELLREWEGFHGPIAVEPGDDPKYRTRVLVEQLTGGCVTVNSWG